jgi:hypothetical protein
MQVHIINSEKPRSSKHSVHTSTCIRQQEQLENAFLAENVVSAAVQSEVENIFLIKQHRLRHKETLNGLNQVMGF